MPDILNKTLNTGDSPNTTLPTTAVSPVFMPSRPIVAPVLPGNIGDVISNLRKKITPVTTGSQTTTVHYGLAKSLLSLSATQEPAKQQDRVMSQVIISFTRDANDQTFAGVRVWFIGYKGSTTPLLMASGSESPIIFLCEATGEKVTVLGQLIGQSGITQDLSDCAVTTVTLNGQTQAPPAPSISQSLIGTSTGYQFSFNQIPSQVDDVIDGYNVYRNTSGTLDGSQTKIQYIKNNPQSTGATVVTDTIVPATGVFYYYWVSSVDTQGLESSLTAAQSGVVAGAIGSIPPTIASSLSYGSTTSTITWSWASIQSVLRADGTVTNIGAGSQAVTGLRTNEGYNFYPVYDETQKILRFIGTSDVNPPNVTGVTLNSTTGEVTTTTQFISATSFTLEAWVQTPSGTGIGGLVTHAAPQTGAITSVTSQIYINAGFVVGAFTDTASAVHTLTSPTGYVDGQWHHVAYVVVGSTAHYLYVDGVQVATATVTTNPNVTSRYLRLGRSSIAGFLNGTLAYCAYYPAALNAFQVMNHFNALTTLGAATYDTTSSADLPSYQWYLNETSGTVAADSAGSNTGTYTGGFTLNQSSPVISASGSPAIAWTNANYLALQSQNLRNLVPLSAGAIQAATTASGSGGGGGGGTGGGGGGSGRCFSPNTRLMTQRGDVRFDELTIGDYVLTAKATWRRVNCVTTRPYCGPTLDMGDEELVTPEHLFLKRGRFDSAWVRADELCPEYPVVQYDGTIWNAHVDSPDDDILSPETEHSYTLANGHVVHNVIT